MKINILKPLASLFALVTFSAAISQTTIPYSGGMVNYTVPTGVTSITIEAWGAQGGNGNGAVGGLGAKLKGTFTVSSGQVLKVLVGGQGVAGYNGGGGGGTFVATISNTPLIVAGGGGGGYYGSLSYSASNANASFGNAGIYGINGGTNSTSGAGGAGGLGGGVDPGAYQNGGAGGGGFGTDGADAILLSGMNARGGRSFINGGGGGAGTANSGAGGVGGGGGADGYYYYGGGGGGGYGGGGGGAYFGVGGGGGSFNSGTSQVNIGNNSGNGQVIITNAVSVSPIIAGFTPSTGTAGNTVTITGTNFTGATAVTIGGKAVASFAVASATVITAIVSSGSTGVIVVTTPSGSATSASAYTYIIPTPPGNALSFNAGTATLVTIPSTASVSNLGVGGVTLEAWVYYTSTSGVKSIIRKSHDYDLYINGNVLGSEVWPTSASNHTWVKTTGTTILPINQWVHVAAVWDNVAGTHKLYINGVLDPSATGTSTNTITSGLFIGGSTVYTSESFTGKIDELRIYKSPLTVANIRADMLNTASSVPANLVAYYNFDEGTAGGTNTGINTLVDQTSNSNNGSMTGFALTGTASNWVESYAMTVPTATAATSITASGFTANWTAPTVGTVTNYLVDVSTSATFASVIAGSPFTVAAPALSRTFTGLTAGTTYYYRVRADKTSVTAQGATPAGASAVSVTTTIPTGPTGINTGLLLWLDASDPDADGNAGNDPANNTGLATWKDKSGNVNDALKITSPLQNNLTYLTNQVNGKSVMHFTRSADAIGSALKVAGVDLRAITNPQVTIFTVYKPGTHTNGEFNGIWGNDNSNWDRFFLTSWNDNNNSAVSLGQNSSPTVATVPDGGLPGTLRLMTAVYKGNVSGGFNAGQTDSSAIYFNGAIVTRFTDGTDASDAQTNLSIGWDGDGSTYNGDIAEMIVYNRKLTDCEILQVNKYLADKYGQSFTSATISPAGTNTICQNGSLTLSASAGTSYQWYKDGVSIPSATAATYSATLSGTYTVAIANSAGCSATSAGTVITVSPLPTVSGVTGTITVCSGLTTTLTAASSAASPIFKWYTSSTGGTALFTGAAYTTAPLTATGTYYVDVTSGSCTSATRMAVPVSINSLPTPSVNANGPTAFCSGGSVGLSVSTLGNALTLNGTNYAQSTNAALPLGNASRTIEAWVKGASSLNGVIANWGQTFTNQRSGLIIVGGKLYFVGENNDQVGNIVVNDNVWHHVAITFDGSALKLYVDGVLDISVTKNLNTTGSILRIGQRAVGDAGSELFAGSIDELRIWNVARTQTELQNNRLNEIPGNTAGLVAYYKFNESTGLSLADASNNNVTSTLTSAATFAPSGNLSNITSYSWAPGGATTSSITATATGSYSVTVTNAIGCTATSAPLTVTVNPLPVATIVAGGPLTFCAGGSVVLTASAGSSYLWSNAATTQAITVTASGNYTVKVTNANNCSATSTPTSVTVNALPVAAITANGTLTFCAGGSVVLTASAGTSYLWSNGATSQSITVTASGNYTVTVTNANNCSATSAATTVTVNVLPTATTSKVDVVCPGGNTGSITVNATSGTSPYQYSINGGTSYQTSNLFSGLTTGSYPVYIKSADACANSAGTVVIAQVDNVLPSITAPVSVTVTLGGGNCTTTGVSLGTPVTSDNCTVASVTNNAPATYALGNTTVTWTVTDNSGNIKTAAQTVTVVAPEINITGNNTTIVTGDVTPSTSDNTDFGVTLPGTPVTKTYTIQNTGTSSLNISSVSITGAGAADFVLTGISTPLSVPAGGSTTFNVTFSSATAGIKNVTVAVSSSDCDEASYSFAVKAEITCTTPSFAGTQLYIQQSTSASSCDAVVNYPLSVSGTPAPTVTYTFTGATNGTGSGTGSGRTFNTGITHVTVSATNACGTVTTSFDITVVDDVKPVPVTKNITVYLDQTGHVTVNAADLDNGSHDNCGPVTLSMNNSGILCGTAAENGNIFIQAPNGALINAVTFASYGTPTGTCGNFIMGGCNASNSMSVASGIFVGHNSGTISATNNVFGDPCNGTVKRLYVQATYASTGTSNTFDCSNLGTNNVTFIVTDAAGNAQTATAIVTVVDRQGPTITAPDIYMNAMTPSQCGTNVGFNVTATDCTPGAITYSYTQNSGTFFPIGITPVTVTATDVLGNASTATFNVTVIDAAAPVVTTPGPITVNSIPGTCGAPVNFAATATDCSGVRSITYSPQPNSIFPVGTSGVTVTATDINGYQAITTFTVIVLDNEPPVITNVPANITKTNDPNNCGARVTYTTPTATDNCGGSNSTRVFPYTGAQETFVVPAGVTSISVDMSGAAGGSAYSSSTPGSGGRVLGKMTVTPGQTLYINVGGAGKNSDYNTGPGTGGFNGGGNGGVNWDYYYYYGQYYDAAAGGGGASDIRTGTSLLNRIMVAGGGGGSGAYYSGGAGGDLTGGDGYSYYGTATGGTQYDGGTGAYYYGTDGQPGSLGTGGDGGYYTMGGGGGGGYYGGGGGAYGDGAGGSSFTGVNVSNVVHIQGVRDGDGVVTLSWATPISIVQTAGLASGASFPVGTTVNTFKATDAAGNFSEASFTVTVTDNQKPKIVAPVAKLVNNDAGKCGATVNITTPVASDNCGVATTVGVRSDALALTADYPVGTTTITWTVTDIHNNQQTATQTVTVTDNEKPVPVTANLPVIKGECSASVTAPTATDNCAGIITATTVSPVSYSVQGTYTITWTYTDNHANTFTQTQTVIVKDVTRPVITAPVTINVNNDGGRCGATVAVTAPASSDNCAVVSTTGVRSDALPLIVDYPVGTTTITWSVTDIGGNLSTATQTITVTDNERPSITAAANQTQTADANDCGANVTVLSPATSDNCGVQSVTNSYTGTSNASGHYPVSTTVITWTVTDIHGNTQTTTQSVTVTDNEKPTITAAANQTQTADANDCGANVIVAGPATHDNCAVQSVTNSYTGTSNASGHYPVGTTVITWTVTDIHGNTQTTTQSVTVTDNEKPTIVAAANQTQTADANDCGANVIVVSPATNDNCGVQSVTNSYTGTSNASGHYPVGTTVITWTVTDIHGNTQTTTQSVTVTDNEKPTIVAAANQTQTADANDCGANVIVAGPVTHDNCAVQSVTNNYTGTSNASSHYPVGTTIITWTVTDIHGNTQTTTQSVTITDNEKPTIVAAANQTQTADANDCGANVIVAGPVTHDNCAVQSVTNSYTGTSNASGHYPVGTTVLTWTVTDIHGNTQTATQSITVTDNQKPVIVNLPANIILNALNNNCSTLAGWTKPTATDNCGITSIVSSDPFYDTFGFTLLSVGVNTITYTATDIHGNTTTASFTVTVVDNQVPIITGCPADITVNAATGRCDNVVIWNPPTASDNCPGVSLSTNHVSGETFPVGNTTVTYTATDHAGLTAVCSFTVTVVDAQKPILSGAPANTTVECDAVPHAAIVTASDNCTSNVPVIYNETRTNGNCNSNYILTRTWSATDAAGNNTTATQVITVQDTKAPVLTAAPANVTVECNAVPAAATLTATDNCDAPVVTYAEVRTNGNCISNYTLTRTWTATDACGNTSSKAQVITVRDTKVPVLSAAPANVTVECDAIPTAATLTATDNCDAPVVTYTETRTNGNSPSNYTLTRVWTATDACGNTSSKTQAIIVQDTKAPVLSIAPANVTVECDAVPTAATLTATDNCDAAPVVTYTEVRTNGNCPSNYILTRTWSTTDASGNNTTATQVITVQDTKAPVLSAAPASVTVECDAVPAAATLTATDNCDAAPAVAYAETRTNGNSPSNYTLTRVWTATDACGNTSSKTQIVTVQDTQAPVLSVAPADATVECDAVPTAATLTATDNCDATPVVTYTETRTNGNCPSNYTLTRTWTATDASGNASSKTQIITVQDTQAPVLSAAPSNTTVECDAVPAAATLTATDNCDTPVVTYAETRTNGNSPSNYTLTRVWTATDACGNASSKTQIVTVQDTQAPVLSVAPDNVTVECDAVPTAATLTATDNCDAAPVVTYTETRTNGNCPSNYTLTRTWTATDASGNASSKTQIITVQDTQAPVLSAAPSNTTVECDAVPTAATLTATDNCDTPVVTYTETRTNGNSPSNYTLTRVWTATDACGNTSSKTQIVTVQDTQAPVLSVAPDNVTVECDVVPTAATLTATDNCDAAPVVTYTETRTNGNCPSNYTLTRTWTATDASGNASSKTQIITVQDTQAPVLSAAPSNTTVECDAVPAAATLTATDNCDTPVVTYAETRTNGNSPSNYTLTRVWTATDACGNTSSKTQIVTVQDTQAPVLSVAPDNVTVECDAVPTAATLTATDNCDATPVVTYTEVRTSGNCPSNYTLTRTWTATDASGNASSKTQIITVQDTQAPVLSAAPSNTTVECNAVPAAATLTATDNCSTPAVVYTETRTNGNCPSSYTLTRTWTATDACGNTSSKTQLITVQDTKAPVLSARPASVTVECSAVPAAPTVTATDNCDASPVVTYTETRTNGSSAGNYTLTRTWTATDACGNTCSHTQTITVRDTQAPIANVSSLPTLTGDCSVSAPTPTATDNCAGTITGTTLNPTSYTAQGVYTITWSYNDGNGNTSTQLQRIVVKDVTPPAPTAATLPTVTGQCSATVTTKPTATDVCSGITAAGTTTDPLTYTAQGTYTIHWTYTDSYGNQSHQDQTVIVKDNIAPVPTAASLPTASGQCSAGVVIISGCADNCYCCRDYCHCRGNDCNCRSFNSYYSVVSYWLDLLSSYYGSDDNHDCDHDDDDHSNGSNTVYIKVPTATDNCKGTITGTTTDPLTYSTQGTYTIHWKFDDGNGNISVQEQTVIVNDNVAPVANSNSLSTIYGVCSVTVTNKPTAKDNCVGTITGTTADPLTYSGNGTYTIHWIYNDGHGNTTTQNQTVVLNDNIKPNLNEPNDITIACGSSTLPAATGNATATDNCGTPVITYSDVTSGNKITRTWKATDANGNYSTDTQVITIADNTKPTISVPSAITVACGSSTLPAATGTATANDNCSTPAVTYTDNTNGYVITRTWRATDAAGNYITANQTITIVDNVKPTISVPNNVTVNCGSSTNPSATGAATGSDACSSVSISYSDASANSVITRTWKATDASGNFITAAQTITIVDVTKPVITDISDMTISCGSSTLPSSCGGTPNASDNCSSVTVTYSDVTAGNKITRTWKATDAAGNFATSTQVITIVDNTKPVLTEPNDITVNCGASTAPSATGTATATDNCSAVTITYTDVQSGNVITRTWKATDASGNYDTDVQKITIGSAFTASVTSVPTNSTYTGGVNTNLYLGYGAQSTTLSMCSLPSAGAPYSYVWSSTYSNKLNSTTTASPVFTPATFGYYTFNVTVTNKYGCTSTASVSICVTDIRVPGTNGAKVYVCHTTTGKNATSQTLQVAINQVSSHIGSNSCGSNGNDRLGSCDQSPCNTTVSNSIVSNKSGITKEGETVATSEEELKVTVMPNPTTTYFTLKLESKFETPINMRVMDARGRVVDAKSKIGANSTIQIGHNYSSGTYYAELIQGNVRKVVQMIKGRG